MNINFRCIPFKINIKILTNNIFFRENQYQTYYIFILVAKMLHSFPIYTTSQQR